jgi:hypothetical protein
VLHRWLDKAGADGEALDKVRAVVDKKAGVEPRFLGSEFFSRNLKRGRFKS